MGEGLVVDDIPCPGRILLGEVNQWLSDVGIIGDKSLVEVGKAEERLNVFDFCWSRPFCYTIELYGIHGELSRSDDHSEIFYLRSCKGTFFQLQVKVEIHHSLKDPLGLFSVGGFVGGEYEEVIHIDNQPPFGYYIPE